MKDEWNIWKEKVRNLEEIKVTQCFKQRGFSKIKDANVHHFSDASGTRYRQASYLQLVSEGNQVRCSLLIGNLQ